MARQWLVRVPLNYAVGPGAVHAEFMEGCAILENGAEQAKIRSEFAILLGTENVEEEHKAEDVLLDAASSTTASTRSWRVRRRPRRGFLCGEGG